MVMFLLASWVDKDGNEPFWFTQSAGAIVPTHVWKKPVSMMEWFVRKHTYAGDVIWDLYGCTGSCAIAAANLGRPFVYCESFQKNFDAFTPMVLKALEDAQTKGTKKIAPEPVVDEATSTAREIVEQTALTALLELKVKERDAAVLIQKVLTENPNASEVELTTAALRLRG